MEQLKFNPQTNSMEPLVTDKCSISELKQKHGVSTIEVGPSAKEGIFLFSCGSLVGYMSAAAHGNHNPDELQFGNWLGDDGSRYPMITLKGGNSGPKTVEYTL